MKRLLLLGVLSCSIGLRADEAAIDLVVVDDSDASDVSELLKPIDDAVELPAVEPTEVAEQVEVAVVEPVEVTAEEFIVADQEDDVTSLYMQPGVILDEEHDFEVQQVIEEMVAKEEAALQAEDAITTLIEYQSLEDLLKTEPHKNGKLFVIVKKLLRAGFGVATSAGLGHLIKTKASTWAEKHSLPLHAGLGILACGLYETLLYTWQDNQAVYRSILGHIVQNWNIYTMLIPEEYVDTFNALHAAYVQNGNQLTVTEKEAKNIVKTMKYSVRSEIKKRKPQSHTHDKKR